MPSFAGLEGHRLAERMQRLRENPFAAYGIAVAAVAVATMIRWAIGGYVQEGIPFTLYLPAVVIATLLGGFWPGVLATLLSSLVAWLVFIPPAFEFALTWPQGASLLTFILISLLLVVLVTALNSALDRLLIEIEQRRYMELATLRLAAIVESSDDAIIYEASGILNWALQGYWNGRIKIATRSYRTDNDTVGQFTEACCVEDAKAGNYTMPTSPGASIAVPPNIARWVNVAD